jgi:sRNA-binding carbon storage regulator CsrA
MLVIGRLIDQEIYISVPKGQIFDSEIKIRIVNIIRGHVVRVGVVAPDNFQILRDNAKTRIKKEFVQS